MKEYDYCEKENKLYKYYDTKTNKNNSTNKVYSFEVIFFNKGGSYFLRFCWLLEDNRISINSTIDYSGILNLLYVQGLIPSNGEVASIKFKNSKDFIKYCKLICNCIEEYTNKGIFENIKEAMSIQAQIWMP